MGQENGSRRDTIQHYLGVCASVHTTLAFVGLKVLLLREEMLPSRGYRWSPTKFKSIAATWSFWHSFARKSSITEVVTMMVRLIDPAHYEAEGFLLHNSGRNEYLWH